MGTEPTKRERAAWDAWDTHEPGAEFADEVVARLDAEASFLTLDVQTITIEEPTTPVESPWRRWLTPAAAAAGVMTLLGAGALLSLSLTPSPDAPVSRGSWPSQTRPPTELVASPEVLAPPERDALSNTDPLPATLAADVQRYIEQYGRNFGPAFRFHGVVAVARQDAQHVWGFGHARADANHQPDANTRFRLGTLTQQFVAVATLRLVEQGRLGLDDTVYSVFPTYPNPANAKQITIRNLLSHTSGLTNISDAPGYWKAQYTAHRSADLLEYFALEPLEFRPGSNFSASNSNYVLLGLILERVGEAPLANVLEQQIFTPAGMHDTSLTDDPASKNRAAGYEFSENEVLLEARPVHLSAIGGAGAAISTANDMIRWHRALLDNTLLSATSRKTMHRPVQREFGLGWVIRDDIVGRSAYGHPGGTPGFNANILRFADGTLVVALANTEAVDCRAVSEGVAALVFGEAPADVIEAVESPLRAHKRRVYAGEYRLSRASRYKYRMLPPQLLARMERVRVTSDDRLWFEVDGHGRKWMHHERGDAFFFKDHPRTTAAFERDERNIIQRLRVTDGAREFVLDRVD